MDLVSDLWKLKLTRKLSPDEDDIAKALMSFTFLPQLLKDIANTNLLIIPIPGRANNLLPCIAGGLRLSYTVLPIPVPCRMSFVCSEVSGCSASTICGLFTKLFEGRIVKFVGVISYSVGCGINNSGCPGPIIWILTALPGITFDIKSTKIQLSISYADSTTRGCQTENVEWDGPKVERSLNGVQFVETLEAELMDHANCINEVVKTKCLSLIRKFPLISSGVKTDLLSQVINRARP